MLFYFMMYITSIVYTQDIFKTVVKILQIRQTVNYAIIEVTSLNPTCISNLAKRKP